MLQPLKPDPREVLRKLVIVVGVVSIDVAEFRAEGCKPVVAEANHRSSTGGTGKAEYHEAYC